MTTWTEAATDRLIELWGKGISASRISASLFQEGLGSFTRNAAIGKAHRLGLESRPSPIRGNGRGTRRRAGRRIDQDRADRILNHPNREWLDFSGPYLVDELGLYEEAA